MQPFDARDCSYFPVTPERLGFPGGRSVRKERRGRWPETMCHTHPPTHTHRHRHRHRHTHTDTDTQPHTDQEGGGQKVGTTTEVLSRAMFSGSSGTRVVVGADTEALFGSGGNAPRCFSSPITSVRPLPFWPVGSFFTKDFFHLPLCRPLTTTP